MIEINDDELRAIDKAHKKLQSRFSMRPWTGDFQQMIGMRKDITEVFSDIGFEVTVTFKKDPLTGMTIPDVEFTGRTDKTLENYLKTETDWERKEFDYRKTSVAELQKESQNTQLLE